MLSFLMQCLVLDVTFWSLLGGCAGSAAAVIRIQGSMMHYSLFDCTLVQLHQCRIAFLPELHDAPQFGQLHQHRIGPLHVCGRVFSQRVTGAKLYDYG